MDKISKLFESEQYFKHPYEPCVCRSKPNGIGFDVYVRFSHGSEYEPSPTGVLVADALLDPEFITKEEYYDF